MNLFFLLFTPAEGGAPGYLSRKGEEAAASLADSVHGFLTASLGVDLDSAFAGRAKSLEEDVRWRLFRKPDQIASAVQASLALDPRVLLVAGAQERSLNTAKALAGRLALPVCVDARADAHSGEKNPAGSLLDTLGDITSGRWLEGAGATRAVVVGTSRQALEEWAASQFATDKLAQLKQVLERTTQGDTYPAVFACGYRADGLGAPGGWLFD